MSTVAARTVVTGAATGIGAAIVEALLGRGHRVVSFDVRSHRPRSAAHSTAELDVVAGGIDAAFASATDTLGGPIDAIFHVAGVMAAQGADIEDVSDETWNRVIAVNLTGSFRVARTAAATLRRPGGVLMLTSSQGGVLEPSGSLPYGASKGGVHAMVATLEAQFARRGLRLFELVPGRVDTPLYRASVDEAVARSGRPEVAAELLEGVVATSAVAGIAVSLLDGAGRYLRNPVATM